MTDKIVDAFVIASAAVVILGITAAAVVILGITAGHRTGNGNASTAQPTPIVIPVTPAPGPVQPPDQRKPRRPWRDTTAQEAGDADPFNPQPVFADRTGPNGVTPTVDYPEELWFKNIGSEKDGAGMCVFTAFEFSALWAGLEEFRGFRNWCAKHYPGGGTPDKLQKLVDAYCKEKQIKAPDIKQYEGTDVAWLKQCLRNGWLPGCTLFHSSRYKGRGGQPLNIIYHMTNCASEWAILDNNFPDYEWYAGQQAFEAAVKDHGKYWGFCIVAPGAPPIPRLTRGDK